MNMSEYGRRVGGRKFFYSDWNPPWAYNRPLNGNSWFANGFHVPSLAPPPKVVDVVTLSSDDDDGDGSSVKEISLADDIVLNTENPTKVISVSSESEGENTSLSLVKKKQRVKIHWNDVESPPKWTKRMKKFYNRISRRLKHFCHDRIIRGLRTERSEKDNWTILECDVYPPRRREVRCMLCRDMGHMRFDCPRKNLIVCYMCGNEGHKELSCPFRMCLNCGERTEVFTSMCNTCAYFSHNKCSICEMVGHKEEHCSNHWRQYHSVTREEDVVSLTESVPARKSCCNCGGNDHIYEECQELRWSPYTPVSSLVLRMPPRVEEVDLVEGMSLKSPPVSLVVSKYAGLNVEEVGGEGGGRLRLSGPSQLIAAFKAAIFPPNIASLPWQGSSHHAGSPSKKQRRKRGGQKKKRRGRCFPTLLQ